MNRKWKYYNITTGKFILFWVIYIAAMTCLVISIMEKNATIETYTEHMIRTGIAERRTTIYGRECAQ